MLDRLYAPMWAGGWAAQRVIFALAALATLLPRHRWIGDAYGAPDMIFARPPFWMAHHWILTPASATALWAAGIVGLLALLRGGRLAKPGLALWLLTSWLMLAAEALNIKAYDRLLTWTALAMFFAPIGERGLVGKSCSAYGRVLLLLVFSGIYGSTGWLKLTQAGGHWWDGSALANNLVDLHFGGGSLGAWVSGQAWLVRPMSWLTVAFEAGFPLLIWSRRANPWVLAVGAAMHVGILSLMDVGPFSYVALAAYPALLHPEVAAGMWARWEARRHG
jgi:hypothetical protein